jgi:hypothetical protein
VLNLQATSTYTPCPGQCADHRAGCGAGCGAGASRAGSFREQPECRAGRCATSTSAVVPMAPGAWSSICPAPGRRGHPQQGQNLVVEFLRPACRRTCAASSTCPTSARRCRHHDHPER